MPLESVRGVEANRCCPGAVFAEARSTDAACQSIVKRPGFPAQEEPGLFCALRKVGPA